jgi:hypothetical protein
MDVSDEIWVGSKIYSRGGEWVGGERDATVGDDAWVAWQQPKREYVRPQRMLLCCTQGVDRDSMVIRDSRPGSPDGS